MMMNDQNPTDPGMTPNDPAADPAQQPGGDVPAGGAPMGDAPAGDVPAPEGEETTPAA